MPSSGSLRALCFVPNHSRKRALTLPMIRKLHEELGIPAESLIQPTTRAVMGTYCRRDNLSSDG